MTFTEAAVEVLRLVGKPLHYKRIAEIAIERNLLSHVGKTPEITMSSRLATMVKKDQGDAPILKIKPGVFGLREFSPEVLQAAERETGHEYELPKEPEAAGAAGPANGDEPSEGSAGQEQREHPGGDVFPEEDGDDQPIMANLNGDEDRGKRRRRRRRRRKGGDDESEAVEGEPSERRPRQRSERRSRRSEASASSASSAPKGDWTRSAKEGEQVGLGLADAIEAVLRKLSRSVSFRKVAEFLVRDGLLDGDPGVLAPTIAAAIRGDQARYRAANRRLRFRVSDGSVELTETDLPEASVRAERDIQTLAETQREGVRSALRKHLRDLPPTGFLELLASWLNAEGVVGLHGVRRPVSMPGVVHLAGTRKRFLEETRLAIMVMIDGSDIGREHVVDIRGALHHYDSADAACVISLGRALRGAIEEASAGHGAVTLIDGAGVVRALEHVGIGVRSYSLPLLTLDLPLLYQLGLGAERPAEDKGASGKPTPAPNRGEESSTDEDAPAGRRRRRRRRDKPDVDAASDVDRPSADGVAGDAPAGATDDAAVGVASPPKTAESAAKADVDAMSADQTQTVEDQSTPAELDGDAVASPSASESDFQDQSIVKDETSSSETEWS